MADLVASTGRMVHYPGESDLQEFIIGTETGIINRLKSLYPSNTFIPAQAQAFCADMKKISLQDVADALESLQPEIRVPDALRRRARAPLERMLTISV